MMRDNDVVKAVLGLVVLYVGFGVIWWLLQPRRLLPSGTSSSINAEITETDSLLAMGYNQLYEFKAPAYSDPSTLYTAKSRLISVSSLRDSPVNVVVGDKDGWLHFLGAGIEPVQAIGGAVLACGIIAPKDSSDCTIIAAGHDGNTDFGLGGEVRILSVKDTTVTLEKHYDLEWTPMSLCIARKSEKVIVGCQYGEVVCFDLNTDQIKTFQVEGGFGDCRLSHDESLLAVVESKSVSVRRVSNFEDVIARVTMDGFHVRLCWHPTEPDVLMIAEHEVGVKLLNVSNNQVKFIENTGISNPVIIWLPEGQKSAKVLERDWRLISVDLE